MHIYLDLFPNLVLLLIEQHTVGLNLKKVQFMEVAYHVACLPQRTKSKFLKKILNGTAMKATEGA